MAEAKLLAVINDFSSGEVDADVKRSNNSVALTGGRQMVNWRVQNSGKKCNRPGRSALYLAVGRVERVLMSPGQFFDIVFGNNLLSVYNAAGTQVFNSAVKGDGTTAIPWTNQTAQSITYVVAAGTQFSIYICYGHDAPLNVPQVLTWDGLSQTSTWTLTTFAETVTAGGQKRTLFYRLSPHNITMQPGATTGSGVSVVFSANVLSPGSVGTRFTFCGRQVLLTAAATGTTGTITIEESLPQGQILSTTNSLLGIAAVGDLIIGASSGANGIITAVGITNGVTVQLIPTSGADNAPALSFTVNERIVGPAWAATLGSTVTSIAPQPVSIWQDEVMNLFRGYPTSVFFDQSRLGLCNFPALPSGIAWSAISLTLDFYEGALANDAIFEIAPGKSQVLFVQPGMESSEFVFCDNAIYGIPISATNPLTSGTVSFNLLSAQGCFPNVRPQPAEQTILYIKAGGLTVGAVQAPGAYYRPYVIDDVSEFHTHLFSNSPPVAIAVPSGSSQFQELYAYILLADGSMVVGKYGMRSGLLDVGQEGKPKIGWLPWNSSNSLVKWISAQGGNVIFSTLYFNPSGNTVGVVEKLDNQQYLDGALFVNNLPAPFVPPGGKGPLFNFPGPNASVYLIDIISRFMGIYQIDANGFIIPQNAGGENLASPALIAGQPWIATYEPFIQHPPAGEDREQGTRRMKIARTSVSVQQSTGFIYSTTRIPAYFVGDDATQNAPLRESTYRFRVPDRFFDPRVPLVKDTPGPLIVNEYRVEGSI